MSDDGHAWFFWTAMKLWVCSKCETAHGGKAAPPGDVLVPTDGKLLTCAEYRVKKVQEG
ncbi:MAG: hypothetical protein BWY99_00367 [Synergistetes bacterium ADurb.BinA166]|nr:MAG: hypothetical protein BWY99_00367 [Synergistetes bacterium ADurb.BinA166]